MFEEGLLVAAADELQFALAEFCATAVFKTDARILHQPAVTFDVCAF
jgi:hypothetical protein